MHYILQGTLKHTSHCQNEINTEVRINQLSLHFQVYDALSAQEHLCLMSNNTYERYQLINHVKKLIIFDGREIVRCQCQQKKLQGEGTTTIVYNVENRFKISII